jgi:uncharacterized protein (TIGR03437 family)
LNTRIVILLPLLLTGALHAQVNVLTANYDNNRTSANPSEVILNTNNVNVTQFGKLAAFPLDGQVYAQPLYLQGVNIPGQGTHNVVYVATMHNSVYALDADASAASAPFWQVNLGASVNPLTIVQPGEGPYTDIQTEIGILGTPVIDPAGGIIYVVNETLVNGAIAFYLHALDLTTGGEKLSGPVEIQATVQGTGWPGTSDPTNGQLPFNPSDHIQRPGLLLANGNVYVAFGSHGDFVPWHGWIMAYNAANLSQQVAVLCTTPNAAGAAVWQGGRGLAVDSAGSVYATSGNGNYDGVTSWGESVMRLTPTLDVADWFTPAQFEGWTEDDLDFGSTGPILVPGADLLVTGGKSGLVAVINTSSMGHEEANNPQAVQTFQAVPASSYSLFNSALWDRPDGPLLYLWGFQDALRAFQMQNGVFSNVAVAVNTMVQSTYPFSGLTVSSNGFVPRSGILWATSMSGSTFPAAGTLHAFNAENVATELWNSNLSPNRDTLGNFTKFANPTVANGRVYVPTDSQQLAVYGLLNVPGITAVVSAASFRSSTIAPGELVTIFGNSIGPATPVSFTLNSKGEVPTSLGGVTITINGAPAPLLYVSANQVNAIVPFGVSGVTSAPLQLTAPGGAAFSATLPVSAQAPAIFTTAASGSGQGAILNSNLSPNSAANPAGLGSTIAIYASGAGVMSPVQDDGSVTPLSNPPTIAATVTVTIGGQPATVNYHGAAPGLVAGVVQINATVPGNITPGSAVPVTVSVGGTPQLNTVTMAVR